ncbi:MAG TPA: ABC transporter substrate-binding protein [Candidatus Bathyarchaeia archaeon]|nr:ABC transporter substrate-binding protein [Candidatus Bathyarchaeia archaeon]
MLTLFKKGRFLFRLTTAFFRTHKKTIIWAGFVGAFITVISPNLVNLFLKRKPVKIGLVGKYTLADLPDEVIKYLSQGLTTINNDGSVSPALASSWDISQDGKIYRFSLRSGLVWHDGTPVTAADINYNFSDVAVKKIDDQTVEFELKEFFSPFPSVVSRPLLKKVIIGFGDYRVKSVKRNGQIVENLLLTPLDASKKKLFFKFYPSETMAETAFKLGEIDIIKDLSFPDEFSNWPNIKIESKVKNDQFTAIIFNTQNSLLSQKPIRQALAYMLKKNWPNRAYGPINPQSWAYNPNLKRYEYDLPKARELLEKNSSEDNQAGKKIVLTTFPSLFSIAEAITGDWQELGFETEIQVTNSVPDTFQAFLVTEDIPPDPDQYLLWHSTQPNNLSRYHSPQIDKLLEEGRKTFDQDKRRELYLDFQRFLVEDASTIFLYHPTVYTVNRE